MKENHSFLVEKLVGIIRRKDPQPWMAVYMPHTCQGLFMRFLVN
jgi:hypothetical protein